MPQILLVDDEPDLLLIAQEYLTRLNPDFEFHTAESAQKAIETLKKHRFDVIVSDYKMPEMNGLEFLEWLREKDRITPFIMFTGRGREEVAISALNLGANYYLKKGAEPETVYGELAHIIQTLIEYRKTAEALRKSEYEKALILSNTLDNITFQDMNLHLVWSNEAAARSANMKVDELIGRYCYEIWNLRNEPCEGCPVLIAIKTGKAHHDERKTPDGRWWSVHGYPARDEDGEIVGAVEVTREITKQKQAEEELLFKTALLEAQTETAPEGILVVDESGKVVLVNNRFIDLWNVPKNILETGMGEDYLQSALKQLKEPKTFLRRVRHLFADKIESSSEEIRFKDGRVFADYSFPLLDSIGKFLGRIWYFRDVTESKQSEDQFKLVFEAIPNPASLWRKLDDGKIILVQVNRAAVESTNGVAGECIGKELEEIHKPEPHGIAMIKETMKTGNSTLSFEIRGKPPDRKDKYFRIDCVRPTEDTVLTIHTDTTEQKTAERVLKRQKEELSQFVHTIAHDLNNRLSSIEGYTSLLEDKFDPKYLERIRINTENMKMLLNRSVILADSGLVAEKKGNVDLNLLIRNVAITVIPNEIDYSQDYLPVVLGDHGKLVQVFQNLFDNAVTHGNPSRIGVGCQHIQGETILAIWNNGRQIPPESSDLIFDRGFTTKLDSNGIGLTIVQRIINAHGWQITLLQDEKTTFRIHIPLESVETIC